MKEGKTDTVNKDDHPKVHQCPWSSEDSVFTPRKNNLRISPCWDLRTYKAESWTVGVNSTRYAFIPKYTALLLSWRLVFPSRGWEAVQDWLEGTGVPSAFCHDTLTFFSWRSGSLHCPGLCFMWFCLHSPEYHKEEKRCLFKRRNEPWVPGVTGALCFLHGWGRGLTLWEWKCCLHA